MRLQQLERPTPTFADLVFRFSPNWTAVGFFGCLGTLHLANGATSLINTRWEGSLSIALAVVFISIALLCYFLRTEIAILSSSQSVRVRRGLPRFRIERSIPFHDVQAIRVTLRRARKNRNASTLELICPRESIDLPPTPIPQQEALCLAMAINTRLIKVMTDDAVPLRPETTDTVSHRSK